MVVGEILRAVVSYEGLNSGIAQNVFWYILQDSNADDADVVTRVVAHINDDWGPDWAVLGGNSATLTEVELDIINNDGTVDRNLGAEDIDIDGTGGTEHVSAGVAALLTIPTPEPKARGRKYIPLLAETNVTNGAWSGAALAALATMLADYLVDLGGLSGAVLAAGVLSKTQEVFIEFLPSGNVRGIPAYQRRRRPGVGI